MSNLLLRVFDVEHGACSIMRSPLGTGIAMIDSGHNSTTGWRPSAYIRNSLGRNRLDYLFVTNADQDHLSDLEGLWEHNVYVATLIRNRTISAADLRRIKEEQGECTDDVERFLHIHETYTSPVTVSFEAGMDGVKYALFHNSYPEFVDTNNLSAVVFIKYGPFKILFPGDLERSGWLKLLENPNFVNELAGTTVLVASHHGRKSGFCEEIFKYFTPLAVVVSDKPIMHTTQEIVPDYRAVVSEGGVIVENQSARRHVLTTRRDGDITFNVSPDGSFSITTG